MNFEDNFLHAVSKCMPSSGRISFLKNNPGRHSPGDPRPARQALDAHGDRNGWGIIFGRTAEKMKGAD